MAKFVMECPKCKKYVQASSGIIFGLFGATKNISCSCGHVIDVQTESLTSRECSHCGNNVVFDQRKGGKAKCPVCGNPINTMAEQNRTVEFSCRQCGIRLRASLAAETHKCPVCDCENNVAERAASEKIRKDGLASIIKYEGDNETLVWKHPIEDFNMGSQLIVHESQEAIFFRDGQALDLFGAGRYTLETQQLPLLEKIFKLPTDTEGTFHSEVYYINMATRMGVKWGTDTKVRLFDPMTGMHVELGASGECSIRVVNSRKLLLKVVGTTSGLQQKQLFDQNGKGFFRSMVRTQVKSYLAAAIREKAIGVLEIDEHLLELSEELMNKINFRLEEYGLELTEFYVERIVTPDDNQDFAAMKRQFGQKHILQQEDYLKRQKAQTEVNVHLIGAQGKAEALKIQKAAEVEAYRMQAAAEAEEMRLKGYTYQQETARQVGIRAADSIGTAGDGGLGSIAGLGVAFGAMGGVLDMTKDALNSMRDGAGQVAGVQHIDVQKDVWDCTACGKKNITSKFCPECGAKKPEPKKQDTWDCSCGNKGITGKFCGECGAKRPEKPAAWDCSCGNKGITGKFCGECGAKRPDMAVLWDCPDCGTQGIAAKFCPECGHKRDA